MVDVEKIQQLLAKHFDIKGNISVDPKTGSVDVSGSVKLKTSINVTRLPVRFGHVGGNFFCGSNQLKTLEGAPGHVGGYFDCSFNQLKTLDGAPGHVGGDFFCGLNQLTSLEGAPGHVGGDFFCGLDQLTSLEGAPGHVGGEFWVDYQPSLPVLRLLQYPKVAIRNCPPVVNSIITKYAGTGKRGLLGAGVELTRAGFKENARW
jgi:hypothetical protein